MIDTTNFLRKNFHKDGFINGIEEIEAERKRNENSNVVRMISQICLFLYWKLAL